MSKCWYCNNELTTGDNPKHFGICNKCYDVMFKSGDAIIRSLTNKIADLEAKLEEYEKFMKDNEWDSVEEMQETLNKCEKKYFDIQQELAGRKKLCDLRYKQLQNSHQDKISFAVEQLEKVKENAWQSATDISCLLDYTELAKIIDNQIKQLKEMSNEK